MRRLEAAVGDIAQYALEAHSRHRAVCCSAEHANTTQHAQVDSAGIATHSLARVLWSANNVSHEVVPVHEASTCAVRSMHSTQHLGTEGARHRRRRRPPPSPPPPPPQKPRVNHTHDSPSARLASSLIRRSQRWCQPAADIEHRHSTGGPQHSPKHCPRERDSPSTELEDVQQST
jgi:hypothetical protein